MEDVRSPDVVMPTQRSFLDEYIHFLEERKCMLDMDQVLDRPLMILEDQLQLNCQGDDDLMIPELICQGESTPQKCARPNELMSQRGSQTPSQDSQGDDVGKGAYNYLFGIEGKFKTTKRIKMTRFERMAMIIVRQANQEHFQGPGTFGETAAHPFIRLLHDRLVERRTKDPKAKNDDPRRTMYESYKAFERLGPEGMEAWMKKHTAMLKDARRYLCAKNIIGSGAFDKSIPWPKELIPSESPNSQEVIINLPQPEGRRNNESTSQKSQSLPAANELMMPSQPEMTGINLPQPAARRNNSTLPQKSSLCGSVAACGKARAVALDREESFNADSPIERQSSTTSIITGTSSESESDDASLHLYLSQPPSPLSSTDHVSDSDNDM